MVGVEFEENMKTRRGRKGEKGSEHEQKLQAQPIKRLSKKQAKHIKGNKQIKQETEVHKKQRNKKQKTNRKHEIRNTKTTIRGSLVSFLIEINQSKIAIRRQRVRPTSPGRGLYAVPQAAPIWLSVVNSVNDT